VPLEHEPAHVVPLPVSQAVLQQKPSGEQKLPATHPPAVVVQGCPCLLLHAPVASQVPAQRPLGSAAPLTATQLCVLVLHVMQLLPQSLFVQQAPVAARQTVVPPVVHEFGVDPLQT
jgi:hypothetical protein